MPQPAIALQDVSKAYKIYPHPRHRLLEAIWRGRRKYHHDFWALHHVSFQVPSGTTLGFIGLNGSGKSTLLQVIAGIVEPTSGRVTVNGRISSLLELGAGFEPEFTGRENVLMQGTIMGFPREEMLERLPKIEAFAEIGEFIDRPVKTYSSGMFVRLAFAAAIHVDPEILLVDEALAVGDAVFQHRCIRRIRELQESGKTILFVTHDIGALKALCSTALFLHAGELRAMGDSAEVAQLYHAHVANLEARHAAASPMHAGDQPSPSPTLFRSDPDFDARAALFRHGTGGARIRNVELLDAAHRPLRSAAFNQEVIVRVHVEFLEDVPFCILGYFVRDRTGTDLVGTNTYEENVPVPPRKAGEVSVIEYRQRVPLMPGSYSVTTALAYNRTAAGYFDWVDNALVFEVLAPADGKLIHSRVWLPVEITLHG